MSRFDADWYRSILDAMDDMVLVKSPKAEMLWANRAFLDFYGMTEDELFETVDADHSDPENTLQYVLDDQLVVDTGTHLNIPEEEGTRANGDTACFHTVKSPVFQADRVVRTVGVSRRKDMSRIPQRDMAHEDAKAFLAPLKVLTRSFPNPMLMVDVKARVIHTSPLWDETFGRVEITPNTFFCDVYAEHDTVTRNIEACLKTGQSTQTTITRTIDESGLQIFALQISPWSLADGHLGGATIIATDISQLHEQSTALKSANNELMQYSYRTSHDLKGPISTVKGLAQFIVEDIEEGDTREAIANAKKIVAMMERLRQNVRSFLAMARADLADVDASEVDLRLVMEEICEGLAAHSNSAGVEIESHLDVQHVTSQPLRLRQIMENLIANGIRYHASGRTTKFVKVRSSQTDRGVAIDVEDNGIGIPADAGDRIFDRFTRFSNDSEGSGLGLAIVKRNVEALRGTIDVTSSDAGTAFRVVVPNVEAEVAHQ